MKTVLTILIALIAYPYFLYAQDTLYVNDKATVHLQCTSNIIYCDIGSDLVKAAIAPNVPSLLRVKAALPFEQTTTLSVMTDDETFTTYIVKYTASPKEYLLTQDRQHHNETSAVQHEPEDDDKSLIAIINSQKSMLNHIFDTTLKIDFNINSIYTAEDKVYITIGVNNRSSISYNADATFILADIDYNHSTAQDIILIPEQRYGCIEVAASKSATVTYAFNRLTVSENKRVHVNLYEIDGYRNITLKIDSKDIANAKPYIR